MPSKNKKTAATSSASTGANPTKRSAVLVVGMHRSGTSALTKVLNLLGCDLPQNLMPATEANKKGYWESSPISALNEDILLSGGNAWRDWHEFNPDWFETPTCDSYVQQAIKTLESEFGDARLFVLKDPRICLLLPFWRRVFAEIGADPLAIHITRNPIEVAASLAQRDNISTVHSYLMWLRYTLDGEYGTRGLPRSFATYESLLEDPDTLIQQAEKDLKIKWPRYSARVQREIQGFISSPLRHHKAARTSLANAKHATPWLPTTYDILQACQGKQVRKQDMATLDKVRNALTISALPFSQSIAELGDAKSQMAELKASLTSAEMEHKATLQVQETTAQSQLNELKALRNTLAATQKELAEAREALDLQNDQAKTKINTLEDAHNALSAEKQDLAKAQDTLKQQYDQAKTKINTLEGAHYTLSAEKQGLVKAQDALKQQYDQAEARIAELSQARDTLADEKHAAIELQSSLEQNVKQAVAHISTLEKKRATLEAERDGLTAENQALTEAQHALEKNIGQAVARIAELETEHQLVSDAKQELASDNAGLRSELQQVRTLQHAQSMDAQERITALRQEIGTRIEQADQLEAKCSEQTTTIAYLRGEAGRRGDRITVLDEAFVKEQKKASEINSRLDSATQEANALQIELDNSKILLAQSGTDLTTAQSALTALQEELDQKTAQAEDTAHKLAVTESALRQRQHESDQTAQELAAAHQQITDLAQQLEQAVDTSVVTELEEQLQSLHASLERQSDERTKTERNLEQLQSKYAEQDEKLSTSFSEISVLSDLLAATEAQKAALAAEKAGLQAKLTPLEAQAALFNRVVKGDTAHKSVQAQIQALVAVLMEQCDRPYLTRGLILRRQISLLRATGLLDAAWYLKQNADIPETGITAEAHFILFGNTEGRAPNPLVAHLTSTPS